MLAEHVFRARLILLLSGGASYSFIKLRLGTTAPTISRWKQRFLAAGLDGLDTAHPGQKPSVRDKNDGPTSGEEQLRNDSMMAHLLDSLQSGKDIGHYGRLVFAMVSRHFMPHEEVLAWLTRDPIVFPEGHHNVHLAVVRLVGIITDRFP